MMGVINQRDAIGVEIEIRAYGLAGSPETDDVGMYLARVARLAINRESLRVRADDVHR